MTRSIHRPRERAGRSGRAPGAMTGAMTVLAALASVLLHGCVGASGYSFASRHDTEVRTVHVPIFENRTQHEGLETLLTEAIIKRIQRATPWRVTGAAQADTVLSGAIVSSGFRQLSRTRGTGLSQEVAYQLSVDFDWTDSMSGRPLQQRRGFSALSTFFPDRRVGERRAVGEQLASEELAAAIVDELQARW